MMNINDFIARVEAIAPLDLQEEWDNSGWQIKLTDGEISKVMVALEVSSEVVSEAITHSADLLLVHHPLIFGKIARVDNNNITGKLIIELIKHGISVYSTHTPFDKCTGGNNDYLGKVLGLEDVQLMECDFTGLCRTGMVSGEGLPAAEFIEHAAGALKVDKKFFNYSGSLDAVVKKCGWCTGAGAEFLKAAKAAGCDLFITGDLKYHAAQEAREIGINVLDCGHFGTEQIFCENMLALLDNLPEIDIIQCGVDLNPFTAI
jgi:dinuclear metal center YbgI/SA1388 family protein